MPQTYALIPYASGRNAANRHVDAPELQPGGSWARHVRYGVPSKVLRLYEAGHFDGGLIVHNPFGITAHGVPQEWDAHPLAREQGLPHLANGFAAAWRPITARMPVLAYMGHLGAGGKMPGLSGAAWVRRAVAAVEPVLEAGMAVGADASADFPDGSREACFAETVAALSGRPLLTEAIWQRRHPWAVKHPALIIESSYQALKAKNFPDERTDGPELIRFVTEDLAGGVEGWRIKIAEIHGEGHSVAVPPWAWFRELLSPPAAG